MALNTLKKYVQEELEHRLREVTPNHNFAQVYHYAVLPAGKLFRPMLVLNNSLDLMPNTTAESLVHHDSMLLALACEIHHAYTLIHDDLPCMDNDDFRRGKPTVHRQFGQWQAVLAGDGLLILSFQLLSLMKSQRLPQILRLFSWALGAKGLIQGQVMDLSGEMSENKKKLLQTHYLKTGKLFQVCLAGSYLLNSNTVHLNDFIRYMKMGKNLGIVFQLMDDLEELSAQEIGAHELAINPWLTMGAQMLQVLDKNLNDLQQALGRQKGNNLSNYLKPFFQEWAKARLADKNQQVLLKNLKNNEKLLEAIRDLAARLQLIH